MIEVRRFRGGAPCPVHDDERSAFDQPYAVGEQCHRPLVLKTKGDANEQLVGGHPCAPRHDDEGIAYEQRAGGSAPIANHDIGGTTPMTDEQGGTPPCPWS